MQQFTLSDPLHLECGQSIKNVTIVQAPGQVIENGTIVIKDGLIHAVGKNVKVPAYAEVLKADSMYVYAGFIDALSHIGVPAPKADNNANQRGRRPRAPQGVNPGNPPNALAGITPELEVATKLSEKDKEIANYRKLGFTTVHVVPRGRMLPGQGALVNLAGDNAQDMIMKEGVSFFSQLSTARGVFPSTIMGVMTKYRELYKQAEQLKAHHKAYASNSVGMARPESDPTLESFFPVIDGNLPVFFMAPNVRDLHRVMTLKKDLGFNVVLAGVKQGWHMADQMKANNIPVLLSMDMPKEIKAKKADDKKKAEKKDAEKEALEKRKMESYNQHVGQAAAMAKAGISFGLTTMGTKSGNVRKNLQRMIKAGLTEDQALAALTTTPASMFGVDKVLGTVETGKIANLTVSDKPYFAEKSNVRFVIADGHVFRYDAPKKKPAAAKGAKKAAVGGSWSMNIEAPGNETSATLVLEDNAGEISGTMKTAQSAESTINDAELNGSTLFFTNAIEMQGQSITLEFELTFDGDSFEGKVSVGSFGSFDVNGSKNPN